MIAVFMGKGETLDNFSGSLFKQLRERIEFIYILF